MALRDELWAVSGEPHLEVEFDDSHPLAQGCISYGVLINGRPYDVKNRVWLQPAGTTGIVTTQQGLAATTSSGSGDLWTAKFPSYSMTGRNKASVWGLFYSTVSNNTIKRAIRMAGPSGGSVLIIDLGDSANNYLAGSCVVTGPAYPRRNDTAAPAANVLHNVLFTRNSTTHGLYRNGVEVGDANPTTSTANFNDNIDRIYIGNTASGAPLQGGVIAWGAWDRDLSAADAALLSQNPRLLLRQRVEIPEAAGGVAAVLEAAPAAVVSVTGALSTVVQLAAAPAAQASATGALSTAVALAAAAVAQASTTADLSTAVQLTAAPGAAATATAALSTDIPLAAAPAAQATAAAALDVPKPLAATPTTQASATADLGTAIQLAAAGAAVATATADLTAAGTGLAAASAAQAAATADLSTGISLAAAPTAQATATGALGASEIALAAASAAQATTTAALSTDIPLAASTVSECVASASLSTSIQLATAVGAESSASLSLIVSTALFADAVVQAAAQASLLTFNLPDIAGTADVMIVPPEGSGMVVAADPTTMNVEP